MLEEEGKVRVGSEWVLVEEVPYRRMGWVKVAGTWMHPYDAAQAEKNAQMVADKYRPKRMAYRGSTANSCRICPA